MSNWKLIYEQKIKTKTSGELKHELKYTVNVMKNYLTEKLKRKKSGEGEGEM